MGSGVNGSRAESAAFSSTCGAAFGDSFTFSDEVSGSEAWVALLSEKLNCNVANHGVPGYGQDQAFLKYSRGTTDAGFVLFVLYQEMLKRNMAASWTFYAKNKDSPVKPYFQLDENRLVLRSIQGIDTLDKVVDHHANDVFYSHFKLRFPYTLNIAKKLFDRVGIGKGADTKLVGAGSWINKDSLALSKAILERSIATARGKGHTPVVVFMPTPSEAVAKDAHFGAYIADLESAYPDLCIVNPIDDLYEFSEATGNELHTAKGHFNPEGNAVIATSVANGLAACDLHRWD